MENGDLAGWSEQRYIVILEGVMVKPKMKRGVNPIRKGLFLLHPTPSDDWEWSVTAIKQVVDKAQRLNVPVDVVTFEGQEVADRAAEYFSTYNIPVSEVYAMDFEMFCTSLLWRPEVSTVIDSDIERIQHYGQRGYVAEFGGTF